jgi:hypothetical protein
LISYFHEEQRIDMKKVFGIFILALLVIMNINCGGGGGSATISSGKTTVTIALGQTRTASDSQKGLLKESSTIPSSVVSVRFRISAPDMATIERTVAVAGKTTISESFEVPNGANRDFVVEALDASDFIRFRGETFVPMLNGQQVFLSIVMVSTDHTAPAFGGITSATAVSTTEIQLAWAPATDNITPQDQIQYLIYMATTSGGQNFASPSFVTSAGATSFTVPGLNPNTTYYFIVRAKDEAGNIDTNAVERSATTFVPPDTTAPTFGGLISATAQSQTEIALSWNPATDNVTPSSNIVYLVYMATTSGGQNFAIPSFTTSAGTTSLTVTELTPATTYYFVVRAKDAAGNIDANTVEHSATTFIQQLPGTIAGSVRNAVTNEPLQDVSVTVYSQDSAIATGATESNGNYSVSVPSGSGYRIDFLKEGYLSVAYENVSVEAGATTYLETILQIDIQHTGTGDVSGMIVNALNGIGVDDLTINLRAGINVVTGPIVASAMTTDGGYYYFSNLNAGNYTAEAIGTGYNTTYFSVICIGGTTTSNQNATITPILSEGETRIILTWGEAPSDLDSHLTGPLPDGTRFHMYYPYAETNQGSLWPQYVKLDLDDTSSFGPETTTIYQQISGIYRFSVHDFTNLGATESTALSESGAQVRVYRGSDLIVTFNVPVNQGGTLWTVFELSGNIITPINTMSYESNSFNIQRLKSDTALMRNLPTKK